MSATNPALLRTIPLTLTSLISSPGTPAGRAPCALRIAAPSEQADERIASALRVVGERRTGFGRLRRLLAAGPAGPLPPALLPAPARRCGSAACCAADGRPQRHDHDRLTEQHWIRNAWHSSFR